MPGTEGGGEFLPHASPLTPHGATMDDRQLERLKWRSRRGLLELDLLFTRFWEQSPDCLNETDMQALDRLLQLPDNDILDMVMARQVCTDPRITPVIRRLQQI